MEIYIIKTDLKSNTAVSKLAYDFVIKTASQKLCVPQDKITVKREENNKPYLFGYENLKFNISHTDGMIAIAFSDNSIGIDIEKIKKCNLKIAERYFTPDEKEFVLSGENNEDFSKRFFEIWTKKEAYLKFTGEGLTRRLDSFSVFENSDNYKTLFFDDYVLSVYSTTDEIDTVNPIFTN